MRLQVERFLVRDVVVGNRRVAVERGPCRFQARVLAQGGVAVAGFEHLFIGAFGRKRVGLVFCLFVFGVLGDVGRRVPLSCRKSCALSGSARKGAASC